MTGWANVRAEWIYLNVGCTFSISDKKKFHVGNMCYRSVFYTEYKPECQPWMCFLVHPQVSKSPCCERSMARQWHTGGDCLEGPRRSRKASVIFSPWVQTFATSVIRKSLIGLAWKFSKSQTWAQNFENCLRSDLHLSWNFPMGGTGPKIFQVPNLGLNIFQVKLLLQSLSPNFAKGDVCPHLLLPIIIV